MSRRSDDWLGCLVFWAILGVIWVIVAGGVMLAYWLFQQVFSFAGIPMSLTFPQGLAIAAAIMILKVVI